MDDKQMCLTENNEILIAGDLMDGYYRREEATNEVLKDGWYYTGDIGYLDEEGRLFIEGRIRDIIVTENGEKINCNEVDDKLHGLPGSLEVAVFDAAGRMLAERLRAVSIQWRTTPLRLMHITPLSLWGRMSS
jgi:long-chain acyl-CoA synthetase